MPTRFINMEHLDTGEVIARDWLQQETTDGLQQHGARNASQEAKQCRLPNKNYFMNEGQVSWPHRFL
jgi:hypothetical protein